MNQQKFQETVWKYYQDHGRSLPWRESERNGSFNPYKILVSEIMLQQTQVDRVIPKYEDFIRKFPTIDSLATAPFSQVLEQWIGLGYNRRAKYLHDAARTLSGFSFPNTIDDLVLLKGIGKNTAAAILVYSFNQSHVFIETNVRTVYLYHFFQEQKNVADVSILEKLQETLDIDNPREFYWALMDYGTFLKKNGVRNNAQSKHYTKQSKFEGSTRQLRGEILRRAQEGARVSTVCSDVSDDRFDHIVEAMQNEGLIAIENGRLSVA